MKALILSLVIAFSSSLALADSTSCPMAEANWNSNEGALTRKDKLNHNQNSNSVRVTLNGTLVK